MIHMTPFQIFEIFFGLFAFWVGTYQLSQNVKSYFSWLIFFFFLAIGYMVFTDPIIFNTPDYHTYIVWQKLTDWPLFLMPTFCLHIAMYVNGLTKRSKIYTRLAYAFSLFLFLADIHGGLMLQEGVIRFDDYKRIDSFAPGILMIPFVVFCIICFVGAFYHFNQARKKENNAKYILPMIGLVILIVTGTLIGLSFYVLIPIAQVMFNVGIISGELFYVYFVLSYYQLVNERNIFDKSFVYRTASLFLIIIGYLATFLGAHRQVGFVDLIFIVALTLLIIISHSAYEWINTFINDLLYNPSSGLSVVNDQEIGEALKNFNTPERLESSSLLRLNIIKKNIKSKSNSLDELRSAIKSAIEYFKPEENGNRRTKRNLKYHLLRMIAFDEAEEGQILWELGFEDYPVKIMAQARSYREPMFKIESPSNYTYISRNAYLALKKEAIHDVTWRISYLEKRAKRKLF